MGQGQVPEPGLGKKTKKPPKIKEKEIQKSLKLFYSNQFSVYRSLQLVTDCVL